MSTDTIARTKPKLFYKQAYMTKLFKMLGNQKRLQILQILHTSKPMTVTVNDLVKALKVEQGRVSDHLSKLRDNGIIGGTQQGHKIYYAIKDPNVMTFVSMCSYK